jgi:5-methylcytosine-specific restriction endonuclease McrA
MKTCKKCNTEKTLESFSKDKTRKDDLQPYCKQCTSEYKKKHRQENADKLKDYQHEYYKANKLKLAKYHKKYLKNGGRNVRKVYREQNKDRIKQLKINNDAKRRRTKVKSSLSGADYVAWVDAEFKICTYCGINCSSNFHIDHVEPLANSGKHVLSNLAVTCPSCNLSKGSKPLITFLAYKRLLGNEPTEVKDKKL